MPDPNIFFGLGAAKRIREADERRAAESAQSAFSPEDEKLIEKYRSKIITVPLEKKGFFDGYREPTNHEFRAQCMDSLTDFAIQHKEAGIEAVIRHVLKYGATIPEENREKIINFFVEDCKKRTPKHSDFVTCLQSGCNGLKMREHIGNLSPNDPHRNV